MRGVWVLLVFWGFVRERKRKKIYIGEIGKKILFFPCPCMFEEEKDP
jgi:hypothetical protein